MKKLFNIKNNVNFYNDIVKINVDKKYSIMKLKLIKYHVKIL
jgi:hypothetical protein